MRSQPCPRCLKFESASRITTNPLRFSRCSRRVILVSNTFSRTKQSKLDAVSVEETSEGGSVPNLLVTNHERTQRSSFSRGRSYEEQSKTVCSIRRSWWPAHSKTTIPVSCVEQGRWRYRSHQFVSGESHSSSKLRHYLKQSVSDSLQAGQGHLSDQMAVWGEVTRQMTSLGSSSPTGAMADTYQAYRAKLNEFCQRLAYVDGATGVAIAVGKQVVAAGPV